MTKRCITCLGAKPLADFGKAAHKADGLQSKCRGCIADYQRWLRHQKAIAVYEYLMTHPCVDCGEADPIVLDFDHVRGVKRADVKKLATSSHTSLPRVMEEIAKCEVRCANCHRRVTANRGGLHAWLKTPAPRPPSRQRRVLNACGTKTGYNRGCRCENCREAQRLAHARWRGASQEASVA